MRILLVCVLQQLYYDCSEMCAQKHIFECVLGCPPHILHILFLMKSFHSISNHNSQRSVAFLKKYFNNLLIFFQSVQFIFNGSPSHVEKY